MSISPRHAGGSGRLALFLLLLAAIAAAGILWLQRAKPVAVTAQTVARGTVQDSVANTRAGTVKACRRAGIAASIGGQVARLAVHEGDLVKTGQLLVELWNDDLRAQLSQSENEARAADATAAQTCIMAEVAAREAQRQQRLRQSNLTAEEAVDRADGDARAQQAACKAARAQKEVSAALVDVARAKLDRTRLTAPFDGVVAEVNGEIGEFVTPSPSASPHRPPWT